MSERGGQGVPGSADLLALYNRKRALESKYEKKDDLVKEVEALEEEKEALDKEAARIAQQRPIVDDKCKTRQAQLAQVSTDCESDEADLQRSWRIIFAGNAGRPSSQHPPNPLPTSNDKSTEDVQDPSQQSRQSKLNVEENAAAGPATRTGRISKPPPRYSPTPPATNPTRASPNASTNNVMAAARRLSSQPSHRTMADNTPTNSRAKRNQQRREEDPEEVSGHVQKRRKTTAAAQELYTVDISRPRPVLWKEEVAANASRLVTRAEAKDCDREVITHPLEGKPYRAYWRSGSRGQGWYALIVLPLGNFDSIGLHGSFLETELAKSIPSCYERHDSTVFQWAEGYRDGERLVTKRKFPVMWIHEGQTFPLHKDLMMPTPAWYNWLPAPDLRPFSADCASDGNNLIRGYNSAVEYAEQVGRIKAVSQRHTVGCGESLTEITRLPSEELLGENTTGEEHEHEKSVSADDGTSAGGVLAIVSDTAIEYPRDNNEGEDGDCTNMNLRCIRQPNMVMNPNTISGSHHRRNSLVEQSIIVATGQYDTSISNHHEPTISNNLARTAVTVLERVSTQQELPALAIPKTGLNYVLNDASHAFSREEAGSLLGRSGPVVNQAFELLRPKSHANHGIHSATSGVTYNASLRQGATRDNRPMGSFHPSRASSSKAECPEGVLSAQLNRKKNSKFNRTKTGCLTCRGRRKKCDERKPVCNNCLRMGLSCGYPYPNGKNPVGSLSRVETLPYRQDYTVH